MNNALRMLLKGILYAYGIWIAVCLLVLLPALNFLAPGLARDALNRELRSELLLVNPFTLALDARGVQLVEDDGHLPLAFDRLLVDLSLETLWAPGVVLDRFWLRELDVHVLRYEDGRFHFDDLLTDDDEAPAEDTAALPAFTVHDVFIGAHTLAYTDRTRPGPFRTAQSDLVVRTRNLTTVPEREGDGVLELVGDGGGALRWEGVTDLAAGRSSGRLELDGIDLTHLWRYEAERLAFVANSARLDAAFNYAVDWSGATELELQDGSLRLHAIDITPADPVRYPDTHARLADLAVDGIALSLANERVAIDTVSLRGLAFAGFDREESVSLRDIFMGSPAGDAAGDDAAADTATPATDDAAPSSDWRISVGEVSLDESVVEWRTPYLSPEVMRVSPLSIKASAIAWPAQGASPFEVVISVNDSADLGLRGAVDIGSGSGEIAADLAGLQLAWLHPLVHQQLRTDLARGSLQLETTVALDAFAPQAVNLDLRVLDLATVLHETGEEAFTLEQLAVEGARVDVPGQIATIASVRLQRPTGSLHIGEDGQINVNGVLRERSPVADDASAAAGPPNTDGGVAPEADWRVVLDHVVLEDGRLDFADDSLPLPFRAMIGDIAADLRDLDTASQKPLTLTFNGNVDGYAPVVIEGRGTPLAERADAELQLRFRGVDIATMSPYSGTYAGYTIDSGTLSLDLRYALAGQQLDGDNRIVISQMQLGEPIESDLAVELPLKLGIALLTDANGVIDLSVPVSGSVDDPEFAIGKIIGRAIMNVITKAVTAPFRLLAGLVGSDADLENVAFAAGSAALDSTATDALDALAEALTQRPQLSLRIEGAADPVADGRALREAQLEQELLAAGLAQAAIDGRDEAFLEAVTERFAALTAGETVTDSDTAPDVEVMWDALVTATALAPSALETLGNERAAAAKRELVTVGGVDAARIAISFDANAATAGVHMRVDG